MSSLRSRCPVAASVVSAPVAPRRFERGVQALEAVRHPLLGPPAVALMPRGEALSELELPLRLGGAAGHLQRRPEHEMRVAVGWIPPHGLAQPVDRGRHVLFEPIGVSQVEEVVGIRLRLRGAG